jgi:phosphatidylserine decarboxylase
MMDLLIIASAIVMAFVLAALISWKGGLPKKVVLFWGIVIGIAAGFIVDLLIPQGFLIIILIADFIAIVILGAFIIALRFYRDPERVPPETKRVILAPADGKIKYIKSFGKNTIPSSEKNNHPIPLDEFTGTEFIRNNGQIVGIGMSVLDVHVNRAPIAGKIILSKHISGLFLSLKNPDALLRNERATLIIDNGEFRIGIVLIASRLVRKIVMYKKEGDLTFIGERIGMIKFGSQTDVLLPELVTITVSPGEQVYAGQTIIGKY